MSLAYSATIDRYVKENHLPVWVEYIAAGTHGCRVFHDHQFSEIAIVLQGEALHLGLDQSEKIRAGDVLVIHTDTIHAYDQTGNFELLNIVYDNNRLPLPFMDEKELPLLRTFLPKQSEQKKKNRKEEPVLRFDSLKPVLSLKHAVLEEIRNLSFRLNEEIQSQRPGVALLSLSLFMQIIALLARQDNNLPQEARSSFLISDAIDFLNRNYHHVINVDDLAAIVHMSRRSFFRHFRKATSYCPLAYLRNIRIRQATELLIKTELTLEQIASDCGLHNSNYLCRVFRKETGKSPMQFRKQR